VTLEVTILLFYRRTLAIHSHGTRAVVFVTGHIQRRLGASEMRQTYGRHHLGVLPQRGFFNLHDLARIERPGVQWLPDGPPGQKRAALQAQEQMHERIQRRLPHPVKLRKAAIDGYQQRLPGLAHGDERIPHG